MSECSGGTDDSRRGFPHAIDSIDGCSGGRLPHALSTLGRCRYGSHYRILRNTATRTQTWAWPVPSPIHILEPFRAPLTRYTAGHRGVDLAAEVGGTITAPAD